MGKGAQGGCVQGSPVCLGSKDRKGGLVLTSPGIHFLQSSPISVILLDPLPRPRAPCGDREPGGSMSISR